MVYSYEEVLNASVDYFKGDDLAAKVFIDKYALRDNNNNLLEKTPSDMHRRLAKEFARIEAKKFKNYFKEEYIYELFDRFKYIIPQGSILYGCGNNYQTISLSNCYVINSPEDSYGGILNTDEQLVQISKRRGGVGIDLSNLRPTGFPTKNSSRKSTGIKSWMRRYSNSIREVGQDGRRGALMITLSVHHPDILNFINIKNDPLEVTGANISVKYTNEFLEAVENGEEYELRFPVNSNNVVGKISAKQVWDAAVHSAWNRAEPGILFWDNICNYNAIDCYEEEGFKTESTNPCAELPLCIYDSCRLLIQNLFSYVINPFTKDSKFDWYLFNKHSYIAQRLMDDVVDLEIEKIDAILNKIRQDPEEDYIKERESYLWKDVLTKCKNGRRTGLGITGTGDMLAALGIKYGSEESIEFVEKIHKTQKLASYESSCDMAKELEPFPIWDWSKESKSPFLLRIKDENPELYNKISKYGRRNIGNLTIAPTGSMSLLTQTTSGIEPLFALKPYKRRKKINPSDKNIRIDFIDQSGDSWQEFEVMHPKLRLWMEITGETDWIKSPWYDCCAEDLDWKQRVKLQSAAQRHIDHAISSTVNLPENVTEEKVNEIFLTAWKSGCKGITIYRKNCRTGVLVDSNKTNKIQKTNAPKRPKDLPAQLFFPSIKGQRYGIAVGLFEDDPYEIFAFKMDNKTKIDHAIIRRVKSGHYQLIDINESLYLDDISSLSDHLDEEICRLASTSLRHGADIKFVVSQLNKAKGDLYSIGHVLGRVLKKFIPDDAIVGEKCPECGNDLKYSEGCKSCSNCGWGKCG